MQSRFVSSAVAAVIVATGLTLGSAVEELGGSAGAQQSMLAQANTIPGYDPMRRTKRPSDAPAQPEGNSELGGLPDAPGAEDTFYLCSACHSIALVKQQRLSDERWDYLWNWMIKEQGMPEQDEETREAILDYLKKHFSSAR